MWATLIALASFGAASGDIYIYPDVYEHGDGLGDAVNEEALAALLKANTLDDFGERGKPTILQKVDLNNDGRAEIILEPRPVDIGTAGSWFEIYQEKNGTYEQICASGMGTIFEGIAESKNGYAQLLVITYGDRFNPTFATAVYSYDGERYVVAHAPMLSRGQMEEFGIKAYRAKDYVTAEKWFRNLIRSGLGNPVQAENNLALVLLRTKRYQEVIDRATAVMEHVVKYNKAHEGQVIRIYIDVTPDQNANTHYNMGKAYEALNELPAAWRHYHTACKLLPTDDRKATLKRLAGEGVDTAGYEVIW